MSKKNRVKARDRRPLTFEQAWSAWTTDPVAMFGTAVPRGEDPARDYDERASRCYELAAYALLMGTAPATARLVHGTWQGPGVRFPVGHAWLALPDGAVWEPIMARIHSAAVWELVARPIAEVAYTGGEARAKILEFEHWGCWHTTAGVTRNHKSGSLNNLPAGFSS